MEGKGVIPKASNEFLLRGTDAVAYPSVFVEEEEG